MKIILLFLVITFSFLNAKAQCIGNVTIPDSNFKAALLTNTNINTNGDTEISCAEAVAYTGGIAVSNKNISSLEGIEYFTEIVALQAFNNGISAVNLSQNTKLRQVLLESNNLTGSLDVSTLSLLTDFKVHTNHNLTTINIANGNNINTTRFQAQNNQSLTCVQVDDVSYSTTNWANIPATASFGINCNQPSCYITIPDANFKAALLANININTNGDIEISCAEAATYTGRIAVSNKNISSLEGIEYFTEIVALQAFNNGISAVNLSQNTKLRQVLLESNNLTGSLDVSTLSLLTDFKVHTNHNLTTINIVNGNNINTTRFQAQNNQSLTCVQVDDVSYSTTNWANIPATASYSANCNTCYITIPDANFKNALVNNTSINTDNDTEISCTEATAYYGTINVSGLSISNLTGIEEFINVNSLDCSNNSLTNLDVSNIDIGILVLNCSNNLLTTLHLNNRIEELDCNNNELSSLNLSSNYITYLDCSNNLLTYLNTANGNNAVLATTDFFVINNPNLYCIQVDDVAFSNFVWTNIDPASSFSTYCLIPPIINTNANPTKVVVSAKTKKSIKDGLFLYPNPVINTLKIDLVVGQELKKIEVFNLLGKKVIETNNNTIDFSSISSGIYMLKIENTTGKIAVRKIIKE